MNKMEKLVLGTRGSKLALKQTEEISNIIAASHPHLQLETRIIKTTGDENQSTPLAAMGGRGLFVKQIEEALLRHEIDIAVHSLKDLPSQIAPGLQVAAVCGRQDESLAMDAWISPAGFTPERAPYGARVGTSSLRRAAQLRQFRADLQIIPLRGNVNTRLEKAKELEAIVIAVAGLKRLGLDDHITCKLPPHICLPAAGQGALGVEIREGDTEAASIVSCLHDEDTFDTVRAERAFLRRIEGGCQVPVGAWARLEDSNRLCITGMASAESGFPFFKEDRHGLRQDAEKLGEELARVLLEAGAGETLSAERKRRQEHDWE